MDENVCSSDGKGSKIPVAQEVLELTGVGVGGGGGEQKCAEDTNRLSQGLSRSTAGVCV